MQILCRKSYSKLKRLNDKNHIDAVIIEKPENVKYFSNFNPVINSSHVYILMRPDEDPILLVHSLRADHAREESAIDKISLYGKWGDNVPVAMDPIDAIKCLMGEADGTLGLELDYMNVIQYKEIQEKLKPKKIESVSHMLNMMKIVKDEYEISCIRKSAELVDMGVKTTIDYLTQGYSEAEASTEGQYAMRKLWHQKYRDSEVCGYGTSEGGMIDSLHVWCLSENHISYGCDAPKHYYPKEGDLTLPMAWAKLMGIMPKTNVQSLSVEQANLKIMRMILCCMLEKLFFNPKTWNPFKELYFAAAKVYSDAGFENILPGRIGHGCGCSAHEFPSLAPNNEIPLAPGMVITIEPGLMDKNGVESDTLIRSLLLKMGMKD